MHIPDGFLSAPVCSSLAVISAAGIYVAMKKTKFDEERSQIPLFGVTTAFIFAAQMINFPVAGVTSGHLAGGTLAAILLGPWMAMLAMTSVIIIQALFFQDGGIAALGANLFNIALVAPWIGYGVFKLFERWKSLRPISIFIAAWLSVTASAALVAIELFFSGIVPLGLALKAMLTWHSIIGVAEGIITVVVLRYVMERQSNQETFFAPGAEVVER